ncbi:F0F1 ATP synthase subunit epsilon [Glaciecola sp. SC05]|uniref:F0F1 ATP synthase subunit epsilon n=1 Tax=Glaciecola sp. SC05 TaxID=1987355 RepID=UPI0035290862
MLNSADTKVISNSEKETLQLMQLQILLPSKIFANYEGIKSVVIETPDGAFGLLPNRRDFVASLEPGILTFTLQNQAARYLAVDEGIAIKEGHKIYVSVRNAHAGSDLLQLKQLVQSEFMSLSEQDRELKAVLARLESGFMRGFKSLKSR